MQNKIIQFYDLHPINYQQIISSYENKYGGVEFITQNHLSEFDQDHYNRRYRSLTNEKDSAYSSIFSPHYPCLSSD